MLRREKLKVEIIIGSNFPLARRGFVTNSPLKRWQLRFNYFVKKQNESLEHLSLYFHCLAGSANKACVSSIARTLRAMKRK